MDKLVMRSEAFFWVLQALCALNRKAFSTVLVGQQCAAPYNRESLQLALEGLGFDAGCDAIPSDVLAMESLPLVVFLKDEQDRGEPDAPLPHCTPALLLGVDAAGYRCLLRGLSEPALIAEEDFRMRYTGQALRVRVVFADSLEAEQSSPRTKPFGFRWFLPELLRHKKTWQEILLASLVVQVMALMMPLFSQAIIDKVVVHQTRSTLIVIGMAMVLFACFSALLGWLRQACLLVVGRSVDASLGAAVAAHLFRLPVNYFQSRPTGVIATRLEGVEVVREFMAGAGMTLILDLPFLLIFVAIMFSYSLPLTLVVLTFLAAIALTSFLLAPVFQARLQTQFQWSARVHSLLTESLVGMETVKSLQIEPHMVSRYRGLFAEQLAANFSTRQLANTYQSIAGFLEQLMTLLVLLLGAYAVMHDSTFSIGMLVAFQMFASRLSQPMLRLVGLWQQLQQARLAVERLADVMNAPAERYSLVPHREECRRQGELRIERLAFRYGEHYPYLYEDLNLHVPQGSAIAIMGPSGGGKSTLAKLLLGFCQPTQGSILVDGMDARFLSANELRSQFGVVPQDTVLFAGTIYDNLLLAAPDASFDKIVAACKMAGIHDVVEKLPQGYQTEIGERGSGLSGGQRQRLAIARALLKRPSVLIFDEATSALDSQTAEQFAQTINALRGKVTTIFIAHHLPRGLKLDAAYRLDKEGLFPAVLPQVTACHAASS